jgi:SagB-type dehydrogenase family enzyme
MTRFLPRTLADLEHNSLNKETERLFAYHQATKHTYQSVRRHARQLDWANQPNPFRIYEGAETIALPAAGELPEVGAFEAMGRLAENGGGRDLERLDVKWISKLLWHSMAVSAWKKGFGTGGRYSLRVNPSSGNLHPTETYLAVRDFAGIEDGLYHYRADQHALEARGRGGWTERLVRALEIPWAADARLIVGLTSIFWREAWKYRDRAYRYCCHDLGHAAMSVLLAARALGVSGGVVGHFSDLRLTRAMGLDGGDEAPMAFLVFGAEDKAAEDARPAELSGAGIPNILSTEEIPYELLLDMHRATILADPPGPAPITDDKPMNEISPGVLQGLERDAALGTTVRERRSALDFDPDTKLMERGELEQLLDFATRDWKADWRGNFGGKASTERGADFVELIVYVHRVKECEQGVYRWNGSTRKLEQLHRGDVEGIAAYLSLEQALAGNACFAISMIADLARAANVFGNRGYRYAHFEAGAIGQRLYIGATALGWGATGIGAFYDDDVHRFLGILEEGKSADASKLPRQVIYHFAVGRAVRDPRIEA